MDGVYYDSKGNLLGIELSEEDVKTMLHKKKCIICGKEFIPRNDYQKTCGSEECKKARTKQTNKERYKFMMENFPDLYRKKAREAMRRSRERKKKNDCDQS